MSRERRIIYSLALVVFVSCAGIAMPYPVLAPMFLGEAAGPLARFHGLPPEFLLGLIIAAYPLGTFLGSQLLGALSDSAGRRRVLLGSLIFSAALYMVSAAGVRLENYVLLLVSRFLTGLFEGNIAIARAAAADMSATYHKSKSFGLLSVATTGGWLIGPLLGGVMAAVSYESVFVVAAGLTVLAWLATWAFFNEDRQQRKATAPGFREKFNAWVVMRDPSVRRLLLVYFLATMAINTYYEFYPFLMVTRWGLGSAGIAKWTVLLTSAMVLANLKLVHWTAMRFRAQSNILFALGGFIVVMAVLPLPASSASLLITFPLFGMFIALNNTHLSIFVSDHVAPTDQGKVMGLTVSLFSIGNALIAIVGSLLSVVSITATFFAGAGIALIAWILFAFSRFRSVAEAGGTAEAAPTD